MTTRLFQSLPPTPLLTPPLLALFAAATLAACGGGGDDTASASGPSPVTPSAVTFTGLAATGAPLAAAAVTARCSGGADTTGTTAADGSFTLTLGPDRLAPCVVKATSAASETPALTLYSYAATTGRVNITPLTDLILGRAFAGSPAAVFTGFNASKAAAIGAALSGAKAYVAAELKGASVGVPGVDPLVGVFAVGDADDKLLDRLAAALEAAGKTLDDLRAAATTSASFTTALAASPAPAPAPASSPAPAPSLSNASKGILGDVLATVFAGDYILSCRAADDFLQQTAPVTYRFTVNTDGSSKLDGQPWLDATHPGVIELGYQQKAGLESFVPWNLIFLPDSSTYNTISLFWNANGALQLANVTVNRKAFNCQSAGQVVPASTVNIANANFNSVFLKKLARTETLANCPIGGPQVLTLGADGAAAIAGNAFAADQLFNVKDNSFKPDFGFALLQYSSGFIKAATIRSMVISLNSAYKVTGLSAGLGINPNGSIAGSVGCQ